MKTGLFPIIVLTVLLGLTGTHCTTSAEENSVSDATEEINDGYGADEVESPPPPPPSTADLPSHIPEENSGEETDSEIADIIRQMPKFPLPYPNPSASARFSVGAFATWGEVDNYITGKLFSEGFRGSYFYVPSGFALVSQIEQIDAEGNSLGEEYRFSLDNAPALRDDYSFFDYLRALLRPNPGRYRCIVFLLSPEHFQYSDRKLSREEASKWLQVGYNRLPQALKHLPVTEDYELTILVYEFLKPEHDDEVVITVPSRLDALSHIQKANLMFD